MSHISFVFLASACLSYALAFGSEAVRSAQVAEPTVRATSVFSEILASSSVLSGGSQTTDTSHTVTPSIPGPLLGYPDHPPSALDVSL